MNTCFTCRFSYSHYDCKANGTEYMLLCRPGFDNEEQKAEKICKYYEREPGTQLPDE